MSSQRGPFAIIFAVLSTAVVGSAQSTNASIYGTVTDVSGASIPKAALTAANVKTGVKLSTVSNDSGVYIFPSLQPGEYNVTAEVTGFRKAIAEHIQLDVGAKISVDLKLEVGSATESVTVESVSSPIEAVTASVGAVVTQQRVQDLPLQSRNANALTGLQAGVVGDNVNGVRTQSMNFTLDGAQIQETRYNGAGLTVTTSVDRIGEFRVSTAPVDAEFGRGMAQVQMIGRSGTNEVHGSAWDFNRVTALSANGWFNNQQGVPRDFLIRNQFGARVGAPIRKNKTFLFFLYEGQRQKTNQALITTVFTATARQGTFRFFPGVRNGNASAATPTVDVNGNPLQPAGATGSLQSVSLFGRDPNRMDLDSTGNVTKALKDYPLPNSFLTCDSAVPCDGLNTAGFYWQEPFTNDNNLYHLRLDHLLTQSTRLAFSMQFERPNSLNGFTGQTFPNQPSDFARPSRNLYTLSANSTIHPNLVNEFHVGVNRFVSTYETPFSPGQDAVLPHLGAQPFYFNFASVTNTYSAQNSPQGRRSPIYQTSDTLSWLKGRHAIKAGAGLIFDSSNGFNSFNAIPGATTGSGSVVPYANINTIPGIGTNLTAAQNLLGDLSGSVATWTQAFNSAGGKNPTYIPGEPLQRTWRQREYNGFIQDDWKVRKNLTVNLGVRYEYYSPPFEANGKAAIPVNGTAGAFGISGSSFADAFQPGRLNGSLTVLELVGHGSNNPNTPVFNQQYNTFEPAVGLSWSPRGDNKTVLRAGYMITSDRNSLRNADVEVGGNPGLNSTLQFTPTSSWNLSNLPLPFAPVGQAMSVVPLTDRTQTLRIYDTNLRNQYYQNWNVSLQREITKDSVLTVRYVATKGTRLLSGVDVNSGQIFSNGILDAFNVTRAGGNAPLFDRLFSGLLVSGKPVDGVTVFGSDYVRSNSTYAQYLADGRVGTLISSLNSTKLRGTQNGDLLRAAGLPENFFVTNPQFAAVYLVGNNANSTYHSMQIEYEKRFGQGWTYQESYVWSKALGESELGGTQNYDNNYRNAQNLHFDKRIMNFSRTHVLKSNGIWELPVGRNKKLLRNANRAVDGVLGGWKLSGILTYTSGRPFTVTSPYATFNIHNTGNTPDVTGPLSKSTGQLQFDGNGACFFCNFTQIPDPSRATLTPALGQRSNLFAQKGPNGVILQNPLPGTLGDLAQTFFTGPNFFNLDMALGKTFRVTERFNVELRTDWINATNHADFATATLDANINSATFGRFTGAGSNNNRIVVLGARFNF